MIRFAIAGAGKIAHKFAHAVSLLPDKCQVAAVFARNMEKAGAFAEKFGIGKAFDDLDDMLSAPGIDAVYVSLPHAFHKDAALAAMRRDLPAVCEKPACVSAGELEELIRESEERRLFFMEAMWSRFLPVNRKVREWVASGEAGAIESFCAGYCFHAPFDPQSRLYDPACAGGALLDVGAYPIAYGQMMLGNALSFSGVSEPAENGVDGFDVLDFSYPGGAKGILSCAICRRGDQEARLHGEKGDIIVPRFFDAEAAELRRFDGTTERFERRHPGGNGFVYEVEEICRCLEAGLAGSPLMPASDSLENLRIMDKLRADWGLRYPFEKTR